MTVFRSVSQRFQPSAQHPHFFITLHHLLTVLEGLFLLSPDTKAQTRPRLGFLNRRGFQSSTHSGKPSQKKSLKSGQSLKSGRGHLPSIASVRKLPKKSSSVQGGVQLEPTEADSTLRMVIRLWSHETTRVYLDRHTDSKERMWFLKLLESCVKYSFCGVGFEGSGKGKSPLRQPGGQYTAGPGESQGQ